MSEGHGGNLVARTLKAAGVDAAGAEVPAVTLNYGLFAQNVVDFLVIAVSVFLMVKVVNSLRRQQETEEAAK